MKVKPPRVEHPAVDENTPAPADGQPTFMGGLLRGARSLVLRALFVIALVTPALVLFARKPILTYAKSVWNSLPKANGEIKVIATTDSARLTEALQEDPDDPTLLREFALNLKEQGGAASDRVAIGRKLIQLRKADSNDRAELALALVEQGELKEAQSFLSAMKPDEAKSTLALEASAALAEASGNPERGNELRRQAWSANPTDPLSRLKLAQLGLRDFYEENRNQAQNTLFELARGDGDVSLRSAEVILQLPELTRVQSDEMSAVIAKHPKATSRHRFLALEAELRTHPDTREALISKAVKESLNSGPEDLTFLALALDKVGAHQAVLRAISDEKALLNRDLCILWVKALTQCQEWPALDAFLTSRDVKPLSKGHLSVLESLLLAQRGRIPDAMNSLRLAMQRAIAEGDGETVMRVTSFAEQQGWTDIAIASYEWMAKTKGFAPLPALKGLYAAAAQKKDSKLMLQAAERLLQSGDESTTNLIHLGYLRVLLGDKMELVPNLLTQAKSAVGGGQDTMAASSQSFLLALLCFREGNLEGTRSHLAQIKDWSQFPPGHRSVGAALLEKMGADIQAYQLASTFSTLSLLPEEQSLYLRSRNRAETAKVNP
jgi:thioredoxin-like negative regulator of GroEL